ncbi:hypothetical protein J437_LFUL013700 [Ladona fulva]|uniref:Uncharacterized protein n=1 Tax=Ladona fulva TaxID=123851 RepID=A0A8K0KG92_LADFU|nr:hypothetical protein J437_LFUL013700 [Ladona fulva]
MTDDLFLGFSPGLERGEKLLLRYSQRWAKDFLRRRLDWTLDAGEVGGTDWLGPGNPPRVRHLSSALCPCQYSQRWAKAFLRHQLPLKSGTSTPQDQQQPGGETRSPPTSPQTPTIPPRHCLIARCPCQFIEEHLRYKPPRGKCCSAVKRFCFLPDFSFE